MERTGLFRLHRLPTLVALVVAASLLTGCGILFGGSGPEPTPTFPPRTPVPTFTPTPQGAAPAEPVQAPAEPAPAEPAPAEPAESQPAEAVEVAPTAPPEPEPTATPEQQALLVVTNDIANVRQGPGTTYGLVGTASQGTQLQITGKNPEGDWWQICCVNGEQGWIFGQLAQVQNTESVAVAQNIPPAPAPPTPAPAPPTNTPEPPPPQPQGDPDAGACGGDDGCKFKVKGGPSTAPNGGLELKLQFAFVHGGRGDEAQGSYFVVLKKDGVKLPVSDSVRSWTGNKNSGQLGDFNYEYSMGSGSLPGGSVAGNYVVWVLDGNGERDSDPLSFNIGDGQQGLLWIKFDQG